MFTQEQVVARGKLSDQASGPGRFSRSKQMINCLRDGFLYSEKRVRDILFREVEAVLCDPAATPMIVSRLVRSVAGRARQEATQTGFDFANWDTAGKAVVNSMLGAGVLLAADGTSIPLTITAQATEVSGVVEGYADYTEAYLLEYLIRKLGNVTARDHTALAHAMFRQFDPNVPMEDLEDRVVLLLAALQHRVVLGEDGAYSALEFSS